MMHLLVTMFVKKKAGLPFPKATRLSDQDPWLSVPALQQVWL